MKPDQSCFSEKAAANKQDQLCNIDEQRIQGNNGYIQTARSLQRIDSNSHPFEEREIEDEV